MFCFCVFLVLSDQTIINLYMSSSCMSRILLYKCACTVKLNLTTWMVANNSTMNLMNLKIHLLSALLAFIMKHLSMKRLCNIKRVWNILVLHNEHIDKCIWAWYKMQLNRFIHRQLCLSMDQVKIIVLIHLNSVRNEWQIQPLLWEN